MLYFRRGTVLRVGGENVEVLDFEEADLCRIRVRPPEPWWRRAWVAVRQFFTLPVLACCEPYMWDRASWPERIRWKLWNATRWKLEVDTLLLAEWQPPRRFRAAYRDLRYDATTFHLAGVHLLARLVHRLGGRWMLHRLLASVGFLKMPVTSTIHPCTWRDLQWQWRFWRGPHRDRCEQAAPFHECGSWWEQFLTTWRIQ